MEKAQKPVGGERVEKSVLGDDERLRVSFSAGEREEKSSGSIYVSTFRDEAAVFYGMRGNYKVEAGEVFWEEEGALGRGHRRNESRPG